MRFGIRTFFAPEHVLREKSGHCMAEQPLFTPGVRLHRPRNIVCVLDYAVVAERHSDLQTVCHRHSVLSIKQRCHEIVHVQHEHLAHSAVGFVVGIQVLHLRKALVIAAADVLSASHAVMGFFISEARSGTAVDHGNPS